MGIRQAAIRMIRREAIFGDNKKKSMKNQRKRGRGEQGEKEER